MKYILNDNNFINYEIIDDFIMVKSVFYDDVNFLQQGIFNYIDYFATISDVNYLGAFPGTCNPFVIKYALDYLKNKKFKYRIFYDQLEVDSVAEFENFTLKSAFESALSIPNDIKLQSACYGTVGVISAQNGFKSTGFFSPLKKNYEYVKTLLRYYEYDTQGVIIQECQEKPEKNKDYYQSIRLRPMFQMYKIVLIDGKPNYFPKS